MSTAKLKDNFVEYNGIRYFRAGSDVVRIGTWGEKRTPVLRPNRLDPKGQLNNSKIQGVRATEVDIDVSSVTDSTISVDGSDLTNTVGGNASVAIERIRNGKLKLVLLQVPTHRLKDGLNDAPTVRANLKAEGNDGRIVDAVLVVTSATVAETVVRSGSLDISGTANGFNVGASGGTSMQSTSVVNFSSGSVFGYSLANPKFRRGEVVDFKRDQHGLS